MESSPPLYSLEKLCLVSFGTETQLPHLIVAQLVQIRVHLFKKNNFAFDLEIFFERRFFGKTFNLPHVLEVFHCPHPQLKGCVLMCIIGVGIQSDQDKRPRKSYVAIAMGILQPRRQ